MNVIQPVRIVQVSLSRKCMVEFCAMSHYLSNKPLAGLINGVRILSPQDTGTSMNNTIFKDNVTNRIQQFYRLPLFSNIMNSSRDCFLNYLSTTFNEILFYILVLIDEFEFNTHGLHTPVMISIVCDSIFIETGNKESLAVVNINRQKKKRQLDVFPYRRFIIHSLYCRPSSDIDHCWFYLVLLKHIRGHISARDHSNLLCQILTQCRKDRYILKLVFRKLQNICGHDENENFFVGSLASFWTVVSDSIRWYCTDLDYMFHCLDIVLTLLESSRNRLTFEHLQNYLSSMTKYFGFCGIQCIREKNITVYIQMCEISERFVRFALADKQCEENISVRYAGLYYLLNPIQVFHNDPDWEPLLTILASYVSGEEGCRAKFRELGYGVLISDILPKNHNNIKVTENCYRVLDIATAGKARNVILLFRGNRTLKDEIRYALKHFANISSICERLISIMIKLIKADNNVGKWLMKTEIQERITAIAEYHSNIVTLESACNQLKMLLKFSSPKSNKSKNNMTSPGPVRRSRREGKENRSPTKSRSLRKSSSRKRSQQSE